MCTVLLYSDAEGKPYIGRTNEFVGLQPESLTYFPIGTTIESVTPDNKQGKTFQTKYAILGVTIKDVVKNQKQELLHDGVNDKGLSFSLLSLGGNKSPDVSKTKAEKVLSVVDFGLWALGNFSRVADIKQAIKDNEIEIWLPIIPLLGTTPAPIHFALWDATGEGIVIEWQNGETQVYDNLVGVMTNNPSFPWHLENMKNYAHLTNIDKNTETFNKLKVSTFDSGAALTNVPSSEVSWGRFVKAAYYSSFAYKTNNPELSIIMLGHIMNNFDRPMNISIDNMKDAPVGERDMTKKTNATTVSEITNFTTLRDLTQKHFYFRSVLTLNFTKFDIKKLSSLKKKTSIVFDIINQHKVFNGTDLFLSNN
jgi:penicillin V acylase-like amidase (Ntn superfamily)